MEQNIENVDIVSNVMNTFVKKEVNISVPAVRAAIITAASEMAICSDVIGKDDTLSVLEPLFNPENKEEIKKLIGMAPHYVAANIGFATDFRDFGRAMAAYERQQEEYDKLYKIILSELERRREHDMSK